MILKNTSRPYTSQMDMEQTMKKIGEIIPQDKQKECFDLFFHMLYLCQRDSLTCGIAETGLNDIIAYVEVVKEKMANPVEIKDPKEIRKKIEELITKKQKKDLFHITKNFIEGELNYFDEDEDEEVQENMKKWKAFTKIERNKKLDHATSIYIERALENPDVLYELQYNKTEVKRWDTQKLYGEPIDVDNEIVNLLLKN